MRKSKKQGFSLVEVVLALGVMAFAFLAILGLIPAGMSTFRQAINISVCSQIGQRVIADAFQADYDTLLIPPGGTFASTQPFQAAYRYFDEEGNEIPLTRINSDFPVYTVNTWINPDIVLPGSSTKSPQTTTITVLVIFNPGRYTPNSGDFLNGGLSPNSKILPGNVLTYYAHITRS